MYWGPGLKRVTIMSSIGGLILIVLIFFYGSVLRTHKSDECKATGSVVISELQPLSTLRQMDIVAHRFDMEISNVSSKHFLLNRKLVSPSIYNEAKLVYQSGHVTILNQNVTMRFSSFKITKQTLNQTNYRGYIQCEDKVSAYVGTTRIAFVKNRFSLDIQSRGKKEVIVGYQTLSSKVTRITH